MAKVTSKLQVTLTKAIAEKYNLRPGVEIQWAAAGEVIRVIPPGQKPSTEDREDRLRLFDQATARHRQRTAKSRTTEPRSRGWRREDLYRRGRSR
jgi:bifunctional DNA-binding transcriptional regulator/antitoxin component of YhaV-PrlF toxin-antitoxin module